MLVEIVVFERVRECLPGCMQVKLGIDERISQHPPGCIPVVFPGHHNQGVVLNGNDSGAGWKLLTSRAPHHMLSAERFSVLSTVNYSASEGEYMEAQLATDATSKQDAFRRYELVSQL